MNQLNSLIFEGKVIGIDTSLKGTTVLTMESTRHYRNVQGCTAEEVSVLEVECYDKMAHLVSDRAKIGKGIRMVGRIASRVLIDSDGKKHSSVYAVAEHVEFKA